MTWVILMAIAGIAYMLHACRDADRLRQRIHPRVHHHHPEEV